MQSFYPEQLKDLFVLPPDAHKGMGGKLMIIGGSHLFHGASLWALQVATRMVDMVFYASIPENNALTQKLKGEIYDFIAIPRDQIESYIEEADTILIGPGMVRAENGITNYELRINNIQEVDQLQDEGQQTYYLTKYLLEKYIDKKWVIDAGALQMLEPSWLRQLGGKVVLTPHQKEFETLMNKHKNIKPSLKQEHTLTDMDEEVEQFAKEYRCTVLLKGERDIVCSPTESVSITGGNPGMIKGGTGDVLAGLVAGLACKNDLFLAAASGSYINKKAGERLADEVGSYFNATDLANRIPVVMKQLVGRVG